MKQLFYSRLFVGFLVFLLVFCQPLFVYAAISTNSNTFTVNPDYLIGSASNADPYGIATMELTDEDYGISTFSTLGTVTNTISDKGLPRVAISYYDSNEVLRSLYVTAERNSDNRFTFTYPEIDGYITALSFFLSKQYNVLPSPGVYDVSFDFSSDFAYEYSSGSLRATDTRSNVASTTITNALGNDFQWYSGDVYISPVTIDLGSVASLYLRCVIPAKQKVSQVGGSFSWRFVESSDEPKYTFGSDRSNADYQSDVSGSLSDLSSSIGDMSESLDSAAENLEYISTSQNLIIQGIDNVIMHISDQLYAFWDQLYNLIHEPTYARLEQILLALKAIANNSDISAVVDTIEETTQQQIANDNANTGKVESAVEKHGNFIIEGLKSLFIPSDEYFKSYFDDLYTYFSDRFGFLSFPIDLLVRLIDLFVNAADKDCILTLPDFEISGQPLISEASFNLTEFLERDFAILLSSIRLVTSIGLIIAFMHLCQDKWNEVMRN